MFGCVAEADKLHSSKAPSLTKAGNKVAEQLSEVKAAFDLYNEVAAATKKKVTPATVLNAERSKAIGKILKDHGLEKWKAVLGEIRTNKHYHGENDIHWRASLDWITKPQKFLGIAERIANRPTSQAVLRQTVNPAQMEEMARLYAQNPNIRGS